MVMVIAFGNSNDDAGFRALAFWLRFYPFIPSNLNPSQLTSCLNLLELQRRIFGTQPDLSFKYVDEQRPSQSGSSFRPLPKVDGLHLRRALR